MNERKIDKKHITTAILFAVKYIPNTDEKTLCRFLELVNTTGCIGWITESQLLAEMRLMADRVPDTCVDSLRTIIELLNVCVPLHLETQPVALPLPQPELLDINPSNNSILFG